jgi:hypothetical protein
VGWQCGPWPSQGAPSRKPLRSGAPALSQGAPRAHPAELQVRLGGAPLPCRAAGRCGPRPSQGAPLYFSGCACNIPGQRGADQPNPRRTKFGHGTFCGVRSPAQVPRSGAGGGRRGGSTPPAPAIFAQLLGGRGPLGLPGGPNGPKNGLLCGTLRNEISARRVERGA